MTSPAVEQLPLKYGIVLFPGFQALDAFGALDILNMLAAIKLNSMELSVLSAALDPVPTTMRLKFGESITPTHTFDNAPEDLEVLIVPGGVGTRDESNMAPVKDLIKRVYPSLKFLLTVCTGSDIVAQTGILDGKKATTNKMAWKRVTSSNPNVDWVLKARWASDGNIWTSSGISAGIDMTYAFVSEVYGADVAEQIADASEYTRNLDPNEDPFVRLSGETS